MDKNEFMPLGESDIEKVQEHYESVKALVRSFTGVNDEQIFEDLNMSVLKNNPDIVGMHVVATRGGVTL